MYIDANTQTNARINVRHKKSTAMPSMANGRFFAGSSTSRPFTNISDEVLFEIPTVDDDQSIINTSATVNLIYRIVCPCLLLIGTCGSIMSLKCLYAQRFRKNSSTYIFFFFIALTDLAILYTGALRLLVFTYTGRTQREEQSTQLKTFLIFL